MRLATFLFLSLFLVAPANAQSLPVGVGLIETKEKLKVGGGCDSISVEGAIAFAIFPNGTWTAEAAAGTFAGSLSPVDSKGRTWSLAFDAASLALYELYLEGAASGLCGTGVDIIDGLIETFVLKFGKDRTTMSLQLKASATGFTIFGSGKGKHSIKGKGGFAPGL